MDISKLIGDIVLFTAALAGIVCMAVYAKRAPWYKSAIGRNIWFFCLAVTVLLVSQSALAASFIPVEWYRWLRIVVFAPFIPLFISRTALIERKTRARTRTNKG